MLSEATQGNNERTNSECLQSFWADEIICHIFTIYFSTSSASLHYTQVYLVFTWFSTTSWDFMKLRQVFNLEQNFDTFFLIIEYLYVIVFIVLSNFHHILDLVWDKTFT